MNLDDRVLYRIQISGIKKVDLSIVMTKLHISEHQMIVTADTILIPRLNTRWRGDAAEHAWQAELRKAVGSMGTVTIDVQSWSHAPGYPQGEIGEPSPVQE
jgi:hypothetical protein